MLHLGRDKNQLYVDDVASQCVQCTMCTTVKKPNNVAILLHALQLILSNHPQCKADVSPINNHIKKKIPY